MSYTVAEMRSQDKCHLEKTTRLIHGMRLRLADRNDERVEAPAESPPPSSSSSTLTVSHLTFVPSSSSPSLSNTEKHFQITKAPIDRTLGENTFRIPYTLPSTMELKMAYLEHRTNHPSNIAEFSVCAYVVACCWDKLSTKTIALSLSHPRPSCR